MGSIAPEVKLCQQFGSSLGAYHASNLEQTGKMSDSIGKKLKALRSERLSQDEMAALSGVPRTTIQRIERGESHDIRDIEAISKVLGVSPAILWKSGPGVESSALSPSAIPGPLSASDCAVILARLSEVGPERRAAALAILFDDSSLAPESLAVLAPLLSTIG